MKKAVKMADIADRMKCSTVTVSKALSGQKGVSEELRTRIKDMALEMGYKLPASAQIDGEKKSYNIGVVLSGRYLASYDTFYWKMYQEIADRAIHKECFTLFEIISEEMERGRQLPRLLGENKVDGLIVIGKPGYSYEEFLKKEAGLPLIFLDFYAPGGRADCFISDGFYGTYILTNYLLDKGHRDIAYVGTLFSTDSITDRYMGYVKSLLEHGIEPKREYLIKDRDVKSGLRDNYSNMSFPEKMPTAFVCNCDFIAGLVIKALQKRGLRVPEDISVVGYDNYLYPGLCDVEITTYEVDIREMAKGAIRTLIKKLEGEPYKKGIHIVEGHLVEKNSVAERKNI
ncbi:MAG: LacI family DNA-binding transcriptional regulator [Lachnospiraceae bacterium]|nr:LacI family DNA-binding transcriptional regulator [Lachnospiraceae bacterium]